MTIGDGRGAVLGCGVVAAAAFARHDEYRDRCERTANFSGLELRDRTANG